MSRAIARLALAQLDRFAARLRKRMFSISTPMENAIAKYT
jgi:hypothetical protein